MARTGRQRIGGGRRIALALASVLLAFASSARAATPAEQLKQARLHFEYGDFVATVRLLAEVPDFAVFTLESERVDAYRMLGLASYFQGRRTEADNAFFGLLKQDPDYQLDAFYVPPDAVAFFEDVKARNETYLAPIRERRRARLREQALEDEARREAERRRREQQSPPPLVVERVVQQNSLLAAWMPFGVGQFQNGNRPAGLALFGGQALSAATSVIMYLLIESLRDEQTGKFREQWRYDVAKRLDVVKLASGGLFYALWLGGALEASWNFVPTRVVGEIEQPPSAAPAGPLRPPSRPAPAKKQPVLERREEPAPPSPSLVPAAPPAPPPAPAAAAPAGPATEAIDAAASTASTATTDDPHEGSGGPAPDPSP